MRHPVAENILDREFKRKRRSKMVADITYIATMSWLTCGGGWIATAAES